MKNIVLCGFMGCGKTTVGTLLAARRGMTFVDMDRYIEQQAGRTVAQIFAEDGEDAFRALESDACRTLGSQSGSVIATGGGAVLRDENIEVLSQNGTIVFLDVSAQTVLDRLQYDTSRPLLQRDDKYAAVCELMTQRAPLYEKAAAVTVDANGDAETIADRIEASLNV